MVEKSLLSLLLSLHPLSVVGPALNVNSSQDLGTPPRGTARVASLTNFPRIALFSRRHQVSVLIFYTTVVFKIGDEERTQQHIPGADASWVPLRR